MDNCFGVCVGYCLIICTIEQRGKMESTKEASINLILGSVEQIQRHLKAGKNPDCNYYWRTEIEECLEDIKTEAESWLS